MYSSHSEKGLTTVYCIVAAAMHVKTDKNAQILICGLWSNFGNLRKQIFFRADILTCKRIDSICATNNINNGSILFKCHGKSVW